MRRRLKCVESGAHGRLNMARRHGRVVILHVRQRIIWLGNCLFAGFSGVLQRAKHEETECVRFSRI